MAYITQDEKKIIAAALKVALKDYPTIKYSLSVRDHSTIDCVITKGPQFIDPESKGNFGVNHYHIDRQFENQPEARKVLNLINDCLHIGHYDNSDTQTDYFDCAWYVSVGVGRWDKNFEVV